MPKGAWRGYSVQNFEEVFLWNDLEKSPSTSIGKKVVLETQFEIAEVGWLNPSQAFPASNCLEII